MILFRPRGVDETYLHNSFRLIRALRCAVSIYQLPAKKIEYCRSSELCEATLATTRYWHEAKGAPGPLLPGIFATHGEETRVDSTRACVTARGNIYAIITD